MFFGMTRGFVLGFSVGFGTGFVARELVPYAKDMVRPIAKFAIKSSVLVIERAREGASRLGETVEDLAEEVKSDLRARRIRINTKKKVKATAGGERGSKVTVLRGTRPAASEAGGSPS